MLKLYFIFMLATSAYKLDIRIALSFSNLRILFYFSWIIYKRFSCWISCCILRFWASLDASPNFYRLTFSCCRLFARILSKFRCHSNSWFLQRWIAAFVCSSTFLRWLDVDCVTRFDIVISLSNARNYLLERFRIFVNKKSLINGGRVARENPNHLRLNFKTDRNVSFVNVCGIHRIYM